MYLEVAYALATQKFTGRSIKEREGSAIFYGLGRRAPIFGGSMHFDISLKQRVATYDVTDGIDMPETVTRTTIVPFLGLGTRL
jgi:hypothetical protein